MIGEIFGKLTVKRFYCFVTKASGKREKAWECECSCQDGRTHVVRQSSLIKTSGGTKSCGCLRRAMALEKLKRLNDKRKAVASE